MFSNVVSPDPRGTDFFFIPLALDNCCQVFEVLYV